MSALALSDRQRLDWLRLIRSESIGPRTFLRLLNAHGGAAAALEALPETARRAGRTIRICSLADAEREMALLERRGGRFIAIGEPAYPAALQAIDSAPPLLAISGDAGALARPAVAIVGSRNASAAGMKFAARLAAELGEAGFTVVSGLARGIDTAAHQASVASGTVAVLAGGLGRPYPEQNVPLLERLVETGAAVSEMPLEWTPRGRDFPRRNRIVAGLALGTIVVEAARQSGSLITARFANEQGRIVFAVPGSPLDPRAEGGNHLIREGATLVSDASHVIEALSPLIDRPAAGPSLFGETGGGEAWHESLWDELDLPEIAPAPRLPVPPPAGAEPIHQGSATPEGILSLIAGSPVSVDDLVRASGGTAREVAHALTELDLEGKLRRHPGGGVSRS